jgi:TonB family protein
MTTRKRLGPCGLALSLLAGLVWLSAAHAQESNERKIVKKVEAEYPVVLKRRGIGGTVRLKVLVRAEGTVKDVEVLGGNPALADAAEKAVRQWKFSPGSESTISISVNFDPNS